MPSKYVDIGFEVQNWKFETINMKTNTADSIIVTEIAYARYRKAISPT